MSNRNISLNSLRVLEAAARFLSFTRAAEELHISQAAVSQQIRSLEDQLGAPLFSRNARALTLTAAGLELSTTSRSAINSIQESVEKITGTNSANVLTISTLPSLASRWLIPRLPEFQERHDDIELHIHTSGKKNRFVDKQHHSCNSISGRRYNGPRKRVPHVRLDVSCVHTGDSVGDKR